MVTTEVFRFLGRSTLLCLPFEQHITMFTPRSSTRRAAFAHRFWRLYIWEWWLSPRLPSRRGIAVDKKQKKGSWNGTEQLLTKRIERGEFCWHMSVTYGTIFILVDARTCGDFNARAIRSLHVAEITLTNIVLHILARKIWRYQTLTSGLTLGCGRRVMRIGPTRCWKRWHVSGSFYIRKYCCIFANGMIVDDIWYEIYQKGNER